MKIEFSPISWGVVKNKHLKESLKNVFQTGNFLGGIMEEAALFKQAQLWSQ